MECTDCSDISTPALLEGTSTVTYLFTEIKGPSEIEGQTSSILSTSTSTNAPSITSISLVASTAIPSPASEVNSVLPTEDITYTTGFYTTTLTYLTPMITTWTHTSCLFRISSSAVTLAYVSTFTRQSYALFTVTSTQENILPITITTVKTQLTTFGNITRRTMVTELATLTALERSIRVQINTSSSPYLLVDRLLSIGFSMFSTPVCEIVASTSTGSELATRTEVRTLVDAAASQPLGLRSTTSEIALSASNAVLTTEPTLVCDTCTSDAALRSSLPSFENGVCLAVTIFSQPRFDNAAANLRIVPLGLLVLLVSFI